jgi:hypothetical protein
MRYIPDLIIRGSDESPVAMIDVKGAGELSPERAKGIFENYRATVGDALPAYFLVVSPQRGFLWKGDSLRPDGAANAAFAMDEIFRDYSDPRDDADVPRGRMLEYVVFHWLFDVATGHRRPHTQADEQLRQAGFTESIRDARVSFGLAA